MVMVRVTLKLFEDGFQVVQVRQGFASLTTPSKEFEKIIIEGNLIHDSNPVMRWCIGNTVAEIDPAENKKPSKKKSNGRIDGVSAAVTALARVLDGPQAFGSVYENRGILFF